MRRDLVLEEVARASADGIEVEARAVSAAQVRGVRADLIRLVRSLLDNATRHGRSRVQASLVEAGGRVELTINDTGRESRSINARPSSSVSHGRTPTVVVRREAPVWGLAIAKSIVSSHGGSIEAIDGPLGGLRMRAQMPSVPVGSERADSRQGLTQPARGASP